MGRRSSVHLAVLVPHRDSRKLLRSHSGELFAAGFYGAWSFPHVAVLALLSHPLTGVELDSLARGLRGLTLEDGRDGTMYTGEDTALPLAGGPLPPGLSLYGPALDITTNEELFCHAAKAKIATVFPRPLLGCAVLGPSDTAMVSSMPSTTACPAPGHLKLGFRAAAVANMAFGPLAVGDGQYSFFWKIGEPHWLPNRRRDKPGGRGGA